MFNNHETRETSDERRSFMQNEPKSSRADMNVSDYITRFYEHFLTFCRSKNEPKRTQNEPNFRPKLASFFPNLALFQNKFVAFWYSLLSKFGRVERCEQACLQRTLRREQKSVVDDLPKSIICDNPRKSPVDLFQNIIEVFFELFGKFISWRQQRQSWFAVRSA